MPKQPTPKTLRLDALLVQKGLVSTRNKAQSIIMSGNVLVNDEPITKAGARVSEDSNLRIKNAPEHDFVSRGAVKLERAILDFKIEAVEKIALDIGASTGGFTEVLLNYGASKVFAIDVGQNQLDWKLRNDPRVDSREGVNARYLKFEDIGVKVGIIVMDVSFISITKIIPAIIQFADTKTDWITLIKPQFEAGVKDIQKGGIVKDPTVHERVVNEVTKTLKDHGLTRLGLIESPITGTQGNKEFLAHWRLT